jgi:hypothetical protein
MCLLTVQTEPKILRKDLTVYKLIEFADGNLRPMYYSGTDFIYIKNTIHETEIKISADTSAHDFKAQLFYCRVNGVVSYGQGFHFCRNKKRVDKRMEGYLYRCIIPAGSEVYFDKTGLGITNKIIVIEHV